MAILADFVNVHENVWITSVWMKMDTESFLKYKFKMDYEMDEDSGVICIANLDSENALWHKIGRSSFAEMYYLAKKFV